MINNAGVQSVVVVVVKILGDAGLRISRVGKNGPLAEFEPLRFAAGSQAFILCVIVSLALPGKTASVLRAQDHVLAGQGAVDVAAMLAALPGTTAVGTHDQARGPGQAGPAAKPW